MNARAVLSSPWLFVALVAVALLLLQCEGRSGDNFTRQRPTARPTHSGEDEPAQGTEWATTQPPPLPSCVQQRRTPSLKEFCAQVFRFVADAVLDVFFTDFLGLTGRF
ncbi:hypothetical protein MTO96_041574 [Rhipicephalus appendiculatus]